ncbi:ATP-binding cassette domain-containing protein [Fulvivirga lutea]|uniref:ABC transporter ATP-binding protein n=1 Tax=Fulvivirga lutea TaxID=2810512 RepID=A0A974WHZ9_9BACT|nr:ATP-binding cassette domain-containing protein [Fulvivirga lutea]QSE96470.1 ABC transporter ATP-binding protein [Fulvivirga lutea]
MSDLTLSSLSKNYNSDRKALIKTDLFFKHGVRTALVGETGSGKSTLLKLMAGLEQPDDGEVLIGNERVEGAHERLIAGHKDIAYLSQHYQLPKFITVEEYLFDEYSFSEEDLNQIYAACQLKDLRLRITQELSGGEKQRVALAKQLLKKPKWLLLDEPFSNLDYAHKRIIKNALDAIENLLGTSLILVAHEPTDILPWAERIIVLKNGQVIQDDETKTVYYDPINEYVASLLGAYNLINPSLLKTNGTSFKENLIVRPDKIAIKEKVDEGLAGKVIMNKFLGNYAEVVVQVDKELIIVSSKMSYQLGDIVSLKFEDFKK